MGERYLAFDLGASSGRAILGELGEDDKLAVSEVLRFPNGMVNVGGHLHWDSNRLLDDVHMGMHACAKEGDPASIGIDTWGVDFALLDSGGDIIGLPYAYRDSRTEGAVEGFASRMPLKHLYELTGIQVLPFNTLFQLYSMVKNNATDLDSASTLLMMADLFNYHLTGIKASEFTIATTSHIFNPKKHRWDEEIINALEISPHTIPGHYTAWKYNRRAYTWRHRRKLGWEASQSLPSPATTRAQLSPPYPPRETTSPTSAQALGPLWESSPENR